MSMPGNGLKAVLKPEQMAILAKATKKEALNKLVEILMESSAVTSGEELHQGIWHREKLMSTGIGCGIAIPHVRMRSIQDLAVAVVLVKNGVDDYESIDSKPVHIVIMIVAREDQHSQHLKLLSMLTSFLKHEDNYRRIMGCEDVDALYRLLSAI